LRKKGEKKKKKDGGSSLASSGEKKKKGEGKLPPVNPCTPSAGQRKESRQAVTGVWREKERGERTQISFSFFCAGLKQREKKHRRVGGRGTRGFPAYSLRDKKKKKGELTGSSGRKKKKKKGKGRKPKFSGCEERENRGNHANGKRSDVLSRPFQNKLKGKERKMG